MAHPTEQLSHRIVQDCGQRLAARDIGFAYAEHPAAGAQDATGNLADHTVVLDVWKGGEGDGAVSLVDGAGDNPSISTNIVSTAP